MLYNFCCRCFCIGRRDEDYRNLVLSPSPRNSENNLGLAYVLLVETNPFSELVVIFSEPLTSNIPRYFLDFALLFCPFVFDTK